MRSSKSEPVHGRRQRIVALGVVGAILAGGGLLINSKPLTLIRDALVSRAVPTAPLIVASTAELGELLASGKCVRIEEVSAPGDDAAVVSRVDYYPERLTERSNTLVRRSLDNQVGQSFTVYQDLLKLDQTPANMLEARRQWVQVVAAREAKRLFDEGKVFALPFDKGLISNEEWYYYNTPFRTENRENRMAICAIDLAKCTDLREAIASLRDLDLYMRTEVAGAWNQLSFNDRKARYDEHVQMVSELQSLSTKIQQQYTVEREQLDAMNQEMLANPARARAAPAGQKRAMSKDFNTLVERQRLLIEKLARNPTSFSRTTYEAGYPK